MYNFFITAAIACFFYALFLKGSGPRVNYPVNIIVFFAFVIAALCLRRKYFAAFYSYRFKFENLREAINIANADSSAKVTLLTNLPARLRKVTYLFNISYQLANLTESREICDFLTVTVSQLFGAADNILLFLAEGPLDSAVLAYTRKRRDVVIVEKTGGVLDKWVLRNNQSLLIDDLMRDFRFNANTVEAFTQRKACSFIICPISVGDKTMGILRLEAEARSAFNQEDLRILRNICDLSAVVMERERLFSQIRELAITDSLTSLYLRDYFFARLKEEVSRAHSKSAAVGIIMLDIDDFKRVNDNYGHIVGDIVLKRLAKVLAQIVGDSGNVVARFGGEEFIALLVECDRAHLAAVGEEIRAAIEKTTVSFRRRKVNFTVSLGAALYPDDAHDTLGLIDKADSFLYSAKSSGKNRLVTSKYGHH